ncbi:copper amine oxidase N-terminal domain-containing protein [Brevibacillus sp. HB1.2]|uniref:copper amine oxidase N-terminal domain-containing protein n=1 Tax=Brevibacillus TaxID=55080 RepID=UPI00156AEF15|nr:MULTISPECIES: copper amine oxidase N-terminal domain-containing protein [unclassified Brevibacillus]NRS20182.1 copper amine oxidase N-terminal domain-containing protein [Brevibacillus sp. HB1.4B]NTU23750.1 copper amine oxidase N-terminal domain-containing protein [Brevibacillus sp. HB1.2]
MKKSVNKGISVLLATAVLASPLMLEPKAAYALSIEDVSADDTDADEETEYTIEFEINKELTAGDSIYVRFPSDYSVDKKLRTSDITLEDDDDDEISIDSVSVSKNVVEIEVDEKIKKGTVLTLTIDNITNPEDKGSYEIEVKTSEENSYKGKKITIGKSSSSSSSSSKGDFEASHSSKNAEDGISLTLGKFNLSSKSKLKDGKYIYVDFPSKDMLPKSISKSDVTVNGYKAEYVTIVDNDSIRIEVPSGADGDSYIKLEFTSSAGIVNPSKADKYYSYEIEYDSKKYKSKDVEITGISNTPFTVSLSDSAAGARTSYTFEVDLSSKLGSNAEIEVEFPSEVTVPPILTSNSVTVNGSQVTNVSVLGNKVYFRTPYGFNGTNRASIKFAFEGYLTAPKTAGTYTVAAKIDNKSYKSKEFQITGMTPPVAVDNALATVGLTRATASTPAGISIGIKAMGAPIVRNQGFIEVVLPVGFRVPAYLPANTVTVNGVAASFVGVRGQNLIIIPAQDIPAKTAAQVNIAETAGIVNPATPGVYNIGVYNSEERGLLFSRPATIVSLNGVSFKQNVASFTKAGKTTGLAVAPYTVNGNTLMPTTFFRDALGFSISYTKTTAKVVSGNTVMQFKVGSNVATINGKNVTLPAAVQLKNNVPTLPLKTITERTGYKIIYVNGNYTVYK